jgi:hypothetical protein
MRRASRRTVPLRRRVFLGCEGESERGYGARLRDLLNARRQDVHLDVVLLKPGGGDHLALAERAVRRLQDSKRKGEAAYEIRAILLDSDQRGAVRERDEKLYALVKLHDIRLIWQEPCHEAFLLRHLEGCGTRRPTTAAQALQDLCQQWPAYDKGLPAMRLAERIGEAELHRVRVIEKDLAAFLQMIGFYD